MHLYLAHVPHLGSLADDVEPEWVGPPASPTADSSQELPSDDQFPSLSLRFHITDARLKRHRQEDRTVVLLSVRRHMDDSLWEMLLSDASSGC